jgi:antitoxin ParD1/3/4
MSGKLSVAVSGKRAAAVRKAVKSGAFSSADDVVGHAIDTWQQEIEFLRKAWKEGIESGPSVPLDMAEIKAEARRRFEKAKQTRKSR